MHDGRLQHLDGWPDLETSTSVVRCIKQSFSVVSNRGAAALWDCHIAQFPWMDDLIFNRWTRTTQGNRFLDAPAGTFAAGGLGIYGVLAGTPLDISVAGNHIGSLTVANSFSRGPGRIVGIGFEVTNTTSSLAVQGTATVYRQNQSHPLTTTFEAESTPGVYGEAFSGSCFTPPPANIAQAMLLPGSRQWHAKDGCYVVQAFVGQDNPPLTVDYTVPVVFPLDDLCDVQNTTPVFAPALIGGFVNNATKLYPIHMGGAVFTGLSPDTTLTVTLVYYYETFPNLSEQDILVLGTPSAVYDPVALELFSHALCYMPVGVAAYDNAGGDWFEGIISILRDVAPIAAPFLGAINPGLGAAALAAGGLAGAYLAPPGNPNRSPKLPKKRQMQAQSRPSRPLPPAKKKKKTRQQVNPRLVRNL